jgi:RHS repeat-associated protein
MVTQHAAANDTLMLSGSFGNGIKTIFTRGEKLFELSNHLGNVLVTVSDRRVQNSAGGLTVDSYVADVIGANDYYPFGMVMPGRKFSGSNSVYRFGFNGKEFDWEQKGWMNQYDYGMRVYDPRIGRFLSVDPLTTKYPWLTPFQYASNNPIALIDIDGLEGTKPSKPDKPGEKEGEQKETKGKEKQYAPSDCNCIEADEGYYETQTWYWYSGNKDREAKADWYTKEEYDLITQDWENGQVLPPMTLWEKFPAYSPTSREWNGWGVDENGYLTGRGPDPDLSILIGGGGGKASKALVGVRLMGAAQNGKKALWTIYMGLKKIEGQGEKLFLYIGKAKNGIRSRYSAKMLSEYQIQAFDLLKNIPDNGTALGVEQAIMELNGWTNKIQNAVMPVLSNRNAATVKEIYRSLGLEWLKANVPQWETLFKMQ